MTIDAAIAATNDATTAIVSARAAVDANPTINANLRAELKALKNAVAKLRDESRNYWTAFA